MILRRNKNDQFSTVSPEWAAETAIIFGGGPSLTLEQVAQVRVAHRAGKVRAIAVNDSFLWAEFADVLYAADSQWWLWTAKGTAKPMIGLTVDETRERYEAFAGQRCSIERSGSNVTDDSVHMLRNKDFPYHGVGLSLDPGKLVTARNGGFQALNLAILAGAKTIILLGIDGKRDAAGKSHFFGEHPRPAPDAVFEEMRRGFSAAEKAIIDAGVTVVNCSPNSYIDSFPKIPLEKALATCAKLA